MSYEAWPSPDSPRGPLPRIDDLPIADQGYDQEAVRAAFDAFYRHAAQLDASLKALEAVEAFQRDAMELRNDLRSLRALGIAAPEPAWSPESWTRERRRVEVPSAVPRLAAEAGLVIAVAVVAGVAHFRAGVIVALMALAWLVVAISEWLAARARTKVPASLYEPIVPDEGEPAPYVEVGWAAIERPEPEPLEEELDEADEEPEEPEALTMIEDAPEPSTDEDATPEEPSEQDSWEAGFEEASEGESEAAEPVEATPSGFGRIRRRRR